MAGSIWHRLRKKAGTALIFAGLAAAGCTTNQKRVDSRNVREQSVEILRTTLNREEEWVKVHAAEYLLWAGYPEGVKDVFLKENEVRGTRSRYRIGIWRVLAQASEREEEKAKWLGKILEAFRQEDGPDRIHAAETLAKLRISPANDDVQIATRALHGPDSALAGYTRWSVMFTSVDSLAAGQRYFTNAYVTPDGSKADKEMAAYALGRTCQFSAAEWPSLAEAALSETEGSSARLYMLTCALMTAPAKLEGSARWMRIRHALSTYQRSREADLLSELAFALAKKGNEEDVAFLTRLLNDTHPTDSEHGDADVHAAAAFALIQMANRGISLSKALQP